MTFVPFYCLISRNRRGHSPKFRELQEAILETATFSRHVKLPSSKVITCL